jgi:uncharacterized protein YjiS (DUF1127 family)
LPLGAPALLFKEKAMNTTAQSMTFDTTSQRVVQTMTQRLQAVIERVRLARHRSKLLRELQGLDDHLLRDIGLHRAELPSVVAEVVGASPGTRRQVMRSRP